MRGKPRKGEESGNRDKSRRNKIMQGNDLARENYIGK